MVIVDTSAWVRALAGKAPYEAVLSELLGLEVVLGHDLVYGELLIGDAGARAKLLAEYSNYRYAKTVSHKEVVDLVRGRRLYGKGLSWIDVHLLAAALVEGATVYTADGPLEAHAKALGVAYVPS